MTTTAPSTRTTSADWSRPGPGNWELDTGHFGPDCARMCHELIEYACTEGMRDGFALMGAPLETLEARFVNGRFYLRRRPLISGDRDLPMPPAPVLWAATRLHPAFRRAERTAAAALERRVWLEELETWNAEWKPQLVARSRELAAVDVASLSDAGLADHFDEVFSHVREGLRMHFRLHVSDLGPIGLLLVRGRELGLDQVELMQTLSGSSPATNAPARALAELRAALGDAADGDLNTLDDVRSASDRAAELLDRYLLDYGWRLTKGYDLRDLALAEMPGMILAGISAARSEDGVEDRAQAVGEAALETVLAKVGPEHRAELETLVADARALYGLRDENGPITYQWPAGLLRRALVEAARRFDEGGQLPDVGAADATGTNEGVFDLWGAEVSARLRGKPGPDNEELRRRFDERRGWTQLDAPRWLGSEEATPPLWAMPPQLGRQLELIVTVLDLIESEPEPETLSGLGIGAGTVTARACVVTDADDAMERMQPGDVLVAPYTVPTFNAVLAMAGGVVVDSGGLLCHAAVIAREFGIPGIVGVGAATSRIPDGATIRLDATTGEIEVQAD